MEYSSSHMVNYLLGTTTPTGFKGYFKELGQESDTRLYLIKSGPGCGKSTMMKQLARMEEGPVELIHCSSDPDSLDGVLFPQRGIAIIDATSPHTIDPEAPGANEIVVSLYHTIREEMLRPHREKVQELFERNHTLRNRAARYIASAGSLLLDSRRAAAGSTDFERVRRYAKRLCSRTLPKCNRTGTEHFRFLTALTPKGALFYRETVQALASKIIVFRDEYGAVSRLLMDLIRSEAFARGYDIITCPCAMYPEEKIDHILIPSLGLAFLTDNSWHPVNLAGQQTVRCSRFTDRANLANYRARLRFNHRAAEELIQQAVSLMAQAKNCHDELETYYRAAVDFNAVEKETILCAQRMGLRTAD